MKEFFFSISGYPNTSFHQPLDATLTLSDDAVASGIATASDILSIKITAGPTLPDSAPMTLAQLHSDFLNPTITLSPDRKSVATISAESANGWQYSFWVFFRSFHQTPAGVVENVVKVRADSIEVETAYIPSSASQHVLGSQFAGDWLREEKRPPRNPLEARIAHTLAIDPLALLLPNDVYVRLTLPDPAPFEVVQKYVRERIAGMSVEEFKRAHARVKEMKSLTDHLLSEFEKQKT